MPAANTMPPNGGATGKRLLALLAGVVAVLVAAVLWAAVVDDDEQVAPGPGGPTAATSPASGTVGPDGKPVPSPSPGKVSKPGKGAAVPVEPVRTEKPVPLKGTGDFGTGLTVKVADIKPVKGTAKAPGEISGPALQVTVTAKNSSAKPVSLDGVIAFLSYGKDKTPSVELIDGTSPLRGSLAAGKSATGVYVYSVPSDKRDRVRLEVSYTGKAPTVAFGGSVVD